MTILSGRFPRLARFGCTQGPVIHRALRVLAMLYRKSETDTEGWRRSRQYSKQNSVTFARSRKFSADLIREKLPATRDKIAGRYKIAQGAL